LDATSRTLLATAITTLPSPARAANEASVVNESGPLISTEQKLYPQDLATLDAIACAAVKRSP